MVAARHSGGPAVTSAIRRIVLAAALLAAAAATAAESLRFFQIGTGATAEPLFALGGVIANALSNPPGSRPCDKGGSCGVPGLVAVAKSTAGAVANLDALAEGRLDAALIGADAAFEAVHGQGAFKGRPLAHLRAVAMLAPESVQLVATRASGIHAVKDLAGKRVSFGDKGSRGLAYGRLLLAAHNIAERRVTLSYLPPRAAAEAMAAGTLDAMLVIDAIPSPPVASLARGTPVTIVPLAGTAMDKLRARLPYLQRGEVAPGAYEDVTAPVPTVAVGVTLLTTAAADPDLVRAVTTALWQPATRRLLADFGPRGRLLRPEPGELQRLGITLHPGAAEYYAKAGASEN